MRYFKGKLCYLRIVTESYIEDGMAGILRIDSASIVGV